MDAVKTCSKCNTEKAFTDFNKGTNICKQCRSEYNKEYNKTHKESIREYQKEYQKEYYKTHKESIREYKKEIKKKWYINNKEKVKEYKKTQKEYSREYKKKYNKIIIVELRRSYVIEILKNKGFKGNEITPELIEVQRLITKTKRL